MKGFISVRTFDCADDICALGLRGELDVETAPDLKAKMSEAIDAGRVKLVLDFQDVTYIDSTCLGTMVFALRRAKAHKGHIIMVCANNRVRRVFEITGLSEVFPIFARWSDAMTSLGIPADSPYVEVS